MNVRRSLETGGIGPFAANPEIAHEREILDEVAFHRVISIERRRTERSRKPFLLMLLDLGDHSSSETTGKISAGSSMHCVRRLGQPTSPDGTKTILSSESCSPKSRWTIAGAS